MKNNQTVYVVDDDEDVLLSVRAMLSQRGYEVHCFSSAADFLNEVALEQPGCVVTDLQMPQITGVELQRKLVERGSPLAVVVVTGVADVPTAIDMMQRGAITLLEKPYDHVELLQAVASGLSLSWKHWENERSEREIRNRLATLSSEERAVLQFLLKGALNKSIAATLKLSLRTMDRRRRTILEKMGFESIPELALKLGGLTPHGFEAEPANAR